MPILSSLVGAEERLPTGLLARLSLGEPQPGSVTLEEQIAELRELAALPGILDQTIGAILPDHPREYRAFWDLAKETAGLFRSTYLRSAERERLWAEYSDLCRQVKELGRAEREEQAAASSVNAGRVLALLRDAHLWAGGAATGNDLAEARSRLRRAIEILKTGPFLHRDRQECFAAWREAAAELDAHREGLQRDNFEIVAKGLREASREVTTGNTFEAAGLLRALRAEIQGAELSREQRRLLREELHALWGVLIGQIEARKAERARIQEEKARRVEAWLDRQTQRLDDIGEWREENDRRIARLHDEAAGLEGQIATAWNESWAERARGWVEAKYAKIRDLEARNEELERQIAEIRSRLAKR